MKSKYILKMGPYFVNIILPFVLIIFSAFSPKNKFFIILIFSLIALYIYKKKFKFGWISESKYKVFRFFDFRIVEYPIQEIEKINLPREKHADPGEIHVYLKSGMMDVFMLNRDVENLIISLKRLKQLGVKITGDKENSVIVSKILKAIAN